MKGKLVEETQFFAIILFAEIHISKSSTSKQLQTLIEFRANCQTDPNGKKGVILPILK